MLIGLTGLAGSGKSEVARVLMEECGFERVKFGGGLKAMLRGLLAEIGYCASDIERYIEGDLKESIIPELGVASRQAQIDIGENARGQWHEDVWARVAGGRMDTLTDRGANVIADDVRRPNEAEAVTSRGGVIWRVVRPGVVCNGHETERHAETMPAALDILNDGDLGLLRQRVRHAWMTAPLAVAPGEGVAFTGVPDVYGEAAE